jgi:hypothetical protein
MQKVIIAGAMACLAWLPGWAQAQVAALDTADAQALACLQRAEAKPAYPAADLQARTGGTLRMSLRFTAPDKPPQVTVIFRAASDAMVDEVTSIVRNYRLPCLSGGPVTAVQEFAFRPRATDPITWTPLSPVAAAPDTSRVMKCLVTPPDAPAFGGGLPQREVTNVFVDLGFSRPDAPPEVKVSYSSAGASQEQIVRDYVREYRLPCLPPGARPAWMRQHFQFRPYGVGKRVFKDALTLGAFLSNVKGIREQRVSFDFGTMSCPFQVAWTLGRPRLDNRVGQVGATDPNRAPFLAWLAGLELEMKPAQFEQLVGQTLIINVGCGALDLTGES